MKKAFVSYSRLDLEFVKGFVAEIKRQTGVQPWYDLDGIETGEKFQDVIIRHIDECDIFVFVVSQSSVDSEWVRKEANYADKKGKRIFPIVIDGTKPEGWLLFDFGDRDYVDYNNEEQRHKFFKDLQNRCGDAGCPVSKVIPEASGRMCAAAHSQPVKGHKKTIVGGAGKMAACAKLVQRRYQEMGYQVQQLNFEDGGYPGILVQIRNVNEQGAGKWFKRLVGLETCATLKLTTAGDGLTLEVMEGKWLDKVVVASVSWFVLWPLFVTASIGAYKQKKLLDKVFVDALASVSEC